MRIFKTTYHDRQGNTKQAAKWYVEFPDQNEIRRRIPAFTSKAASQEFGRNLEKLVAYHRATFKLKLIPTSSNGLVNCRDSLIASWRRFTWSTPRRVAAGIPLEDHMRDFTTALSSKGNTLRHVELVTARVRLTLNGCGFRYWTDIQASKVQKYLAGLKNDEHGISAQTFNFYLQAVKQFCRWMVRERAAAFGISTLTLS